MAWIQARIANCKTASIRRTPWIPLHSEEIVGIRDGPIEDRKIVRQGQLVEIDPEQVCYDWTDKKFYKIRNPEGWIYEGVVDHGGD